MNMRNGLRAGDAAGMASCVARRCFSAGLHTTSARHAPVVLKSVAHYRYIRVARECLQSFNRSYKGPV